MTPGARGPAADPPTHLFPPALVPVLRNQAAARSGCLAPVGDDVLLELLTTVFWAGLETYEHTIRPIGVTFISGSTVDVVIPEGMASAAPLYRWKILRFEDPRPFAIAELVKLAVAGVDRRMFTAVGLLPDGGLGIVGLAREGFNAEADPFVKIVAQRPGCLSILSGHDLLVAYEFGTVRTGREDAVFSRGAVRRALEAMARAAGLDDEDVPDYVDAVRSLVHAMAAHRRGGILIVSPEESPAVADAAPYRMARDGCLASLVRLARRIGSARSATRDDPAGAASRRPADNAAFGHLLRNAFVTEAERVTEELGALTAIDGALLLNRDLALVAFGVVLPVDSGTIVSEAMDENGTAFRTIDLGSRGTRHRAAATYASQHPGSVVVAASEDGQLSCLLGDASRPHALLWRLGPADGRRL